MKENKLCECGCGEPVTKKGNRFIRGHNKRNSKWSDEQREKMEKVCSNPEYIQKLSKRVTDNWKTPGYREMLIESHKKRMENPDEQKRLRESREKYWSNIDNQKRQEEMFKEYWKNPENRKNQSERKIQYFKDHPEAREAAREKANKQWSDHELRDAASKQKTEYFKDIENCILASCGHQGIDRKDWTGFRERQKYCYLFNLPLKEAVRLYFNNKCFMDNEPEENGRNLSIHHVNFDKRCGCDATQFCIFVPVKAKWNSIFNGSKEKNRWYWYSFLMVKIFTEHPNYFTYHIPVWGMSELEYNYDYVFEKFRR